MQNKNYNMLTYLFIFLLVIVLSPGLYSGYISDDAFTFVTYFDENFSLPQFTLKILVENLYSLRPVCVMTLYTTIISFLLNNNIFLYKFHILLLVCLNVFLFRNFLYHLFKSRTFSLLCIIPLPLLIQFRNYHDPVLSFAGLMQILFLLLLLSLIYFIKFFDTGKNKFYYFSIIFFVLCLLCYEISFSFFIFHIILYFILRNKLKVDFIKLLSPFILITFSLIGLIYFIKFFCITDVAVYTGTTVKFDMLFICKTFMKQVIDRKSVV